MSNHKPAAPRALLPGLHLPGSGGVYYELLPDQILYAEADNINSIVIWCETDCAKDSCTAASCICHSHIHYSLGLLQEILPDSFVRIHRCYLVNRSAVRNMRPYVIELTDGTLLPVPQRKYRIVRQVIQPL